MINEYALEVLSKGVSHQIVTAGCCLLAWITWGCATLWIERGSRRFGGLSTQEKEKIENRKGICNFLFFVVIAILLWINPFILAYLLLIGFVGVLGIE